MDGSGLNSRGRCASASFHYADPRLTRDKRFGTRLVPHPNFSSATLQKNFFYPDTLHKISLREILCNGADRLWALAREAKHCVTLDRRLVRPALLGPGLGPNPVFSVFRKVDDFVVHFPQSRKPWLHLSAPLCKIEPIFNKFFEKIYLIILFF